MSAELRRTAGARTGAGPETFAAMTPPQHEIDPAFLAEFVEAVDALPAPITLILDDVHELVSHAVLRLAAMSLSEEADPAVFVTAFAGDQHGVADYAPAPGALDRPRAPGSPASSAGRAYWDWVA